jgi:3-hydroxybutyryl-CoA dehydrogenase
MGPLATADLTGIDVMRRASMSIYNETAQPAFYPPELITRMAIAGDLGRKSGRGVYTYGG